MSNTHKYNVGLVQMRMGADPEANFAAAVERIHEAARLGANIVCLPELFRAQYFCQREDTKLFDLAEPVPGPSTAKLAEVARTLRVAIVASLFERRAPGLYHNTAVTLNSDGALVSVYRKMHIPDDPLYYEKYYFTPGIADFRPSTLRLGALARWFAGTSGIRRVRDSLRCRARRCCSIRPPSAGTQRRRRSSARHNMMPGRRSSGRMQLRTVCMLPV